MSPSLEQFQLEMNGIPASPGVVIGRAFVLDRARLISTQHHIPADEVPQELRRLKRALALSQTQLQKLLQRLVAKGAGTEHTYILEAHILMLQDPELVEGVRQRILERHINAEWALKDCLKSLKETFLNIDNEYFQERGSDIDQVGERILRNLLGYRDQTVRNVPPNSIVVSQELSPADTIPMLKGRLAGFVTELGGRTSHIAILARSMEVPALVGVEGVVQNVCTGDTMIVDGERGVVIIRPEDALLQSYKLRRRRFLKHQRQLAGNRALPAITRDGVKVSLLANVEKLDELDALKEYGAEGVGLYRTEFLFLNRRALPDEEEQFQAYFELVRRAAGQPVIIRTLDLGADKGLLGEPRSDKDKHLSPALGLRGVRYWLRHPELMEPQLRAILRVACYGDVRIMVPMISGVEEVLQVKQAVMQVRAQLQARGLELPPHVPLGIMIETPAAAVVADLLAPLVDFFSIGTNDLIHYTLAVDRLDERLSYLYQPVHPAVVRLLRDVIACGERAGIPVSMCGEMAGEPLYTQLLLGLGLRSFSMSPMLIPAVKNLIRKISSPHAKALSAAALQQGTGTALQEWLLEQQRPLLP
ncbi:MAG: phosphoenolpyruvate--protein phosphotransferase [Myxococcota bacterium]